MADAQDWWADLRREAPDAVSGLWFGLVELAHAGWHIYVAGTETFDPDDETGEWACGPYMWWPTNRFFPFPLAGDLATAPAVSAAASLVRTLAPWNDIVIDGAGAGFDDGDFEIVYRS